MKRLAIVAAVMMGLSGCAGMDWGAEDEIVGGAFVTPEEEGLVEDEGVMEEDPLF